jgi:four helix bundle protein
MGEQLFRSAIAAAANYAEVRGAESRNDFIHKLGTVRKELNESLVWLRMVERRAMVPRDVVEPLIKEVTSSAESYQRAGKRRRRTEVLN